MPQLRRRRSTHDDRNATADTTASAAPGDAGDTGSNEWLIALGRRLGIDMQARLNRLGEMGTDEVSRLFRRDFMERISIAVFLLVPVFAALLKLVHVRRDYPQAVEPDGRSAPTKRT